jgi:hypothetical protein
MHILIVLSLRAKEMKIDRDCDRREIERMKRRKRGAEREREREDR